MSLVSETTAPTSPVYLVKPDELEAFKARLSDGARLWLERQQFTAKAEKFAWLPDSNGNPKDVVVGWNGKNDLATLGALPMTLPPGCYELTQPITRLQLLGWGLGAYQFSRYKVSERDPAQLLIPDSHDAEALSNTVAAITLVRDLINTPAEDMLPSMLADEAIQVAETHGAQCTVTVGEELLERGFRTIHAVGRAASDAPRLIDLNWGETEHPGVVLVGKGVCFDSGGLDIKPAGNMRSMKKDMGGAAHVLGLAQLIMSTNLPINLRVLIPAVENAISGNAFRPGDVLQTYQGLTVEVDNTDAEGRLVMCDALALAAEDNPDLILDFSTLTGSARSAVGAEIAAMFSNNDELANGLLKTGEDQDDPIWRLPLHQPYRHLIDSKVADLVNSAGTPFGGAITAALFLEQFVAEKPWAHFDIMAFNTRKRAGRPEGGEAMGMRAAFEYLQARYGD